MEMCKCGKWLVQWSPRTIGAYWIWGDIDGVATSVSGGSQGGPQSLSSPVHILLSLSPVPLFSDIQSYSAYTASLPRCYITANLDILMVYSQQWTLGTELGVIVSSQRQHKVN